MPKVQVYLNPEAYQILAGYRDENKHPNLDEATNAFLLEHGRKSLWTPDIPNEDGDLVKFSDGETYRMRTREGLFGDKK